MTNKPLKEDLGKYKLFVQCGGGGAFEDHDNDLHRIEVSSCTMFTLRNSKQCSLH